jgi:predicted nucleic acid-binding protein
MPPPLLDTSVLLRYLTRQPPELALRARELVEGEPELLLSEIALAEAGYVLTSFYRVERASVVDALQSFVQRRNVRLVNLPKPIAVQALALCRPSRRVSFADALLWAQARTLGVSRVLTFDRKFPSDGLELTGLP